MCNSSVSLFSSRVKQNHINIVLVCHLYVCDFLFFSKKNPKPKNPQQPQPKKTPKQPQCRHTQEIWPGLGFFPEGLPGSFLPCPNSHGTMDWPHLWLCLTAAAHGLSSPPLPSTAETPHPQLLGSRGHGSARPGLTNCPWSPA